VSYISGLDAALGFIGENYLNDDSISDETRQIILHICAGISDLIDTEMNDMYDYYDKIGLDNDE
jgi:hypothetical protein